MKKDLVDALTAASNAPGTQLAHAALVIASIEYPRLVPEPYLTQLDAMGAAAATFVRQRVRDTSDGSTLSCVRALNAYLFQEQGFSGNERYEDPRNSCLNEVLEHRTGIPLTPSALNELRDRGLLAYHLNDVTGALRDLQTYLKLSSMSEMDKEAREEHDQIWEHVKTLRRRVAA